MIERLHVRAFKSLEDVTLDLGRVNVFIGANGSGKSNLLEALGLLSAAASGRVDDESLQRRGVRAGLPDRYRTAFPHAQLKPQIQFEATAAKASYDVVLYHRPKASEPAWHYSHERWMHLKNKIVGRSPASKGLDPEAGLAALKRVELEKKNPAAQLLQRLAGYRIFAPTTPHLRGVLPDIARARPVGLAGGRLAEAVQELFEHPRGQVLKPELLELIDWASDVEVVPLEQGQLAKSVPSSQTVVRFTDKYMAAGRNQLSAYDASEGALYVLFSAVLALHPASPKIFAIDNADHGLNPLLARELTRRFCEWILSRNSTQVLLTSHNPVVLDGLPLRDDRVRLFTVDRTTFGRSRVSRVVIDEKILAQARQGWTLSRLWVTGAIGGVPENV